MEFAVLGPLAVTSDGEEVEIRRGIPRVLMLAMILRVGEAVSPDTLSELAWGGDQPGNPTNALHTQISYLRKALGTAAPGEQLIVTRPAGYVLDVPPDHVDAIRFQRAVERARRYAEARSATALDAALAEFDAALAMWRGPALADSGGHQFAVGEATRLEEARLAALEARAECLLDLGRHRDAAAELQALVVDHPLRERFHELLMLAQYRSGRQADALRTCDAARAVLLDELGLDPGPGLQEMQQLVLEQSPRLTWQPPHDEVTFPAPASPVETPSRRARGRVPAPVARLIGRDDDLERVRELLGQTRLVTLTGPAGAGKTTLAVEVARQWASGSASFVDLDTVAADDLVPLEVGAALGIPTNPDTDPVEAIASSLSADRTLLVLDTCEHVVAGAARLASGLLAACPDLTVLATSRRPLTIRGELAWPVPPLPVPPAGATVDEARRVPAVALFAERAAAVRPDFRITERNAADVAAICAALDGLPLAIELAAARSDTLSPGSIRDRLDDRFSLLVDGGRDAAERQQTLRSALDWSFELLTPDERGLFTRLSVFAGSFGLDEIAAVAGGDVDDPVTVLGGLVRQSMVAVVGDDRYQLLDTPREYGRELLGADGPAVHERHARHYVELASVAADGIWSTQQAQHLGRLRESLGDLRAAVEWAFTNDQDELAARIVGSLSWFFMLEGMFTEGLAYLGRAASAADRLSRFALAGVQYGQGLLNAPLGRLAEATAACERSMSLAREGGDLRGTASALAALSVTEWALGDLASAAEHQDEAAVLYEQAGDLWRRADVLVLRARTALDEGDPRARELLDEVIPLTRAIGDLHAGGMALAQRSLVAYFDGDYDLAAQRAAEALAAHEALDEPEATAGALHLLGRARLAQGDVDAAAALHHRALRLAERIGHVGALCEAVEDLAAVALAGGRPAEARRLLAAADRERADRGVARRPLDQRRIDDLRAAAAADADGGPDGDASLDVVLAELGSNAPG